MTISQHDGQHGWYCCDDESIILTLDTPYEYPLARVITNCGITEGHMREINPFRLTMCVLNDHIKSPQRNNKRLTISSEQQMFASLQPYVDGCLRRATLGKSSLGEAGVLGTAAALSQLYREDMWNSPFDALRFFGRWPFGNPACPSTRRGA